MQLSKLQTENEHSFEAIAETMTDSTVWRQLCKASRNLLVTDVAMHLETICSMILKLRLSTDRGVACDVWYYDEVDFLIAAGMFMILSETIIK